MTDGRGFLDMFTAYFDGDPPGFQFVMPSVALSGQVSESYSIDNQKWHVVREEENGQRWEGIGDDKASAYLHLIIQRVGISADNPTYRAGYEQGRTDFLASRQGGHARRGDAVEAWLKRFRDGYAIGGKPPLSPTLQRAAYDALDDALDLYRMHADTGTPLDSTEPMGPTTAGVTDDA